MKKFAAAISALLAAFFTVGSTVAYAADGGTIYPEDDKFIKPLTLSSLTDYAVGDELYAFADGKTVKVFSDGNYSEYAFENDVTDLDIKDSVIYCGCSDGKTYTLTEQAECEYTFTQKENELLYNGFYYFVKESDGSLNIFDKTETATYEGNFGNLKRYGETIFASSENELYRISGTQCEKVVLEYADYAVTEKITIGQATAALKTYSPVQFVQIEDGAFMTAIDLSRLDGQHFVPIKTVKSENQAVALLLCYSGNSAIVAIGDASYILLKSKTEEIDLEYSAERPFENAQMLSNNIYASPYIVVGTVAASNAIGQTVKVLGRIEYSGVLDTVFYEVEYKSGEATLKGFVAEGFLSEKIIDDDKDPSEITDPEYSDGNDTKTILIIFAVILLVLAAVGYISHVSAKGKRKSKKKDKDKDE